VVTKKQPEEPNEPLVHPDDRQWISEEMAAETLKRAADGLDGVPPDVPRLIAAHGRGASDGHASAWPLGRRRGAIMVRAMEAIMSEKCPRVIADRGDGIYLLDLGNGQGQICETREGVIYPPKNLGALIARGYWEECDDVDVTGVLALVKPV
jgi:hypothetical protein